ncbi:MAG: hypothetical protein Q7J73_06890 [Dehalococcoidales bacterium]|nr:hypothetical protein [Dehalococcoidales bacterium]
MAEMKIPFSSGYVYFSVGVLALTVITLMRLTCPVDGGTGVIAGAQGLKVIDIEDQLLDFKIYDTGCAEIYSDFTYAVNISLVNETSITQFGALLVKFYHPSAVKGSVDLATATKIMAEEQEIGEQEIKVTEEVSKGGMVVTFTKPPVATKLIFVKMPAKTAQTWEETIQFKGFGYQEIAGFGMEGVSHNVSVAPPVETIICPYSHGTGKVSLTEWIRLKAGLS